MPSPRTTATNLPLPWALLPCVATVLGVYVLDRGLVAVAVYHAGIVAAWCLCRYPPGKVFRGMRWSMFAGMGSLCLLAWPALWLLWPHMKLPGIELPELLSAWGIIGAAAWGFAVYSVTLHPVLEETFWRGMLPDHWICDALFAGFHLLVLAPLISGIWLPVVFMSLLTAAAIWRYQARTSGGLLVPILTHALADLGILLAVRALLPA